MPIDEQIAAYRLAMTETANAEVNNLEALTDYQDIFSEVLDLIDEENPVLAQRFNAANIRKETAELALKDAKKAEAEAKANLSSAAFDAADTRRGRYLHPNINIVNATDVNFVNLPEAIKWFNEVGITDITLKVNDKKVNLDWYRAYALTGLLPAHIQLIESHAVRIDDLKKWGNSDG